jgi:non-heme chloroperoxidase
MQYRDVISPDGLRLAAYESGHAAGPEILFIHGFSQCSLCWSGQFDDPLLKEQFRLAAFDIRGHGASDKPSEPVRYAEDRLFADDMNAVMDALELERPVLVGWSYAGRIVEDYLKTYGTARIAGINYVCARTNNQMEFVGPGNDHLAGMTGADAAAELEATRAFVRACFASRGRARRWSGPSPTTCWYRRISAPRTCRARRATVRCWRRSTCRCW